MVSISYGRRIFNNLTMSASATRHAIAGRTQRGLVVSAGQGREEPNTLLVQRFGGLLQYSTTVQYTVHGPELALVSETPHATDCLAAR